MDREKLKDKLSNDEFDITQNKGTEAPFSGKYLETLSCFERWLKKNLQMLNLNQLNYQVHLMFFKKVLVDKAKITIICTVWQIPDQD